jgi:hypothetical protein
MFEIVNPLTVESMTTANGETEHVAPSHIEAANPSMRDGGPRKIVLPRRSGQPRFGPQPYYYHASRTGVLPSWYSAF